MLSDGTCAIIEAIQVERLETPETTYNFEVADFHTYYVSEQAVLVHNVCSEKRYTKDQEALIDLAKETRKGVSADNANILVEWAQEYGLNYHKAEIHVNRSGFFGEVLHIKIQKIHIPIKK